MSVPFLKMHGLGNDFVVIDARSAPFELSPRLVQAIADRRRGVGCDQLIVVEPPHDAAADAFMTIRNADGSEAEACGNGSRCVASLLMNKDRRTVRIETVAGLLDCAATRNGRITVDMGAARTDWRDIPLTQPCDTLHLPMAEGPLSDPVGVGVGNPHAVFFYPEAESLDLSLLGPILERHPVFPHGANIEVCAVLAANRLRMRVWERGAGVTQACGSGACAAAVAAHRRGLTGRKVDVVLDGGVLNIVWREDGHVLMTGPAVISFHGTLDPGLLRRVHA